jgi:hypothetical protein
MATPISKMIAAASIVGTEQIELAKLSTTVMITASTISAAASDNSYNDSGSGFVSAGFAEGDNVQVVGFTGNTINNVYSSKITSLAAGKMITDSGVLVDDAAGESVTITKWETYRTAIPSVGQDIVVGTLAALLALDIGGRYDGELKIVAESTTDAADFYIAIFRSGDQSSNVTNDPYNFLGPDDDSDGSSGAWEMSRTVPQWPQINIVSGTTDTLALTDLHSWGEYTNASGCAITLPPESSVKWPPGAEIHGASTQDTCTFVEGSGVTILIPSGYELETITDTAWTLKKVGTNTWRLIGALVETS